MPSPLTVTAKNAGQRLDVFLSARQKITRSQAQKMIDGGQISLNGRPPKKAGERIKKGDKIVCHCEPRFASGRSNPPATCHSRESGNPQSLDPRFYGDDSGIASSSRYDGTPRNDIKIIAETPDYVVVDKPTGMLTHSTAKREPDSLAEILAKKYPEIKKVGDGSHSPFAPSPPASLREASRAGRAEGDNPRPGIVHRLDKEASGLLAVARTPAMFEHLKNQFKNRAVEKEYLVLTHGKVAKDWDEINFPIARSKTTDKMAAIPLFPRGGLPRPGGRGEGGVAEVGHGKEATTEFLVEKRFVNFTLLRVKIHTGRTHQIRVHLLAYNHPVVGDPLYFQKKQKRQWDEKCGRLFLHCAKLAFLDLNGIKQTFESPLPKELSEFLKLLK